MSTAEHPPWVLVTGAASDIGRATAIAFAAAGSNLVLADINESGLEATCQDVWVLGRDCLARPVDVSNGEAMDHFAEWVHAQMSVPALDVLVNHAGVGHFGPFLDTPIDAWQRVVQVNLLGAVNACRAFLPSMLRAGGKRRIVNVASLAGVVAAPNMSAYAAAQHGVVGFGESLGLELKFSGAEVGVSTVCPGIVSPAHGQHATVPIGGALHQRLIKRHLHRGIAPEVVADAIVRAVRRGRELVLIGPFATPLYGLRRISRRLAQLLLQRDARYAAIRGRRWPRTGPRGHGTLSSMQPDEAVGPTCGAPGHPVRRRGGRSMKFHFRVNRPDAGGRYGVCHFTAISHGVEQCERPPARSYKRLTRRLGWMRGSSVGRMNAGSPASGRGVRHGNGCTVG